jgi:hypothetical protein
MLSQTGNPIWPAVATETASAVEAGLTFTEPSVQPARPVFAFN